MSGCAAPAVPPVLLAHASRRDGDGDGDGGPWLSDSRALLLFFEEVEVAAKGFLEQQKSTNSCYQGDNTSENSAAEVMKTAQ